MRDPVSWLYLPAGSSLRNQAKWIFYTFDLSIIDKIGISFPVNGTSSASHGDGRPRIRSDGRMGAAAARRASRSAGPDGARAAATRRAHGPTRRADGRPARPPDRSPPGRTAATAPRRQAKRYQKVAQKLLKSNGRNQTGFIVFPDKRNSGQYPNECERVYGRDVEKIARDIMPKVSWV